MTEGDKKICTVCKQEKSVAEFHKNKSAKDGLLCRCKSCQNEATKKNYNKEKSAQSAARWRKNNPEKYKEICSKSAKKRYKQNPDYFKRRAKEWREKNIEVARNKSREFREKNPDYAPSYNKAYYKENKEKIKINTKRWREANREKLLPFNAARVNRRNASKRNATPKWANQELIAKLYAEAAVMTAKTGVTFHVDHIVPMQSKIVCGLHCESNLRVIPGKDNQSKGNRYWPDCPDDIALQFECVLG